MEEEIDAWVEGRIASSPAWSPEQWASILAVLSVGENGQGIAAGLEQAGRVESARAS